MHGTFTYPMHDIVTTNIISFWAKAQMAIHCLTNQFLSFSSLFFFINGSICNIKYFLEFQEIKMWCRKPLIAHTYKIFYALPANFMQVQTFMKGYHYIFNQQSWYKRALCYMKIRRFFSFSMMISRQHVTDIHQLLNQ